MFLINNKFDPSGNGMFSKTGKFTNQKFYILSKKDEIINPKKNFYKVPIFSTSKKVKEILKELIVDEDEIYEDDILLNMKETKNEEIIKLPERKEKKIIKKKDKTKEPFFKLVSRDKINYLDNKNKETPPLGIYNPKFLDKGKKILRDYNKELIPKFDLKNKKKTKIIESDLSYNPDKLKKKVYGYYDFKSTTNRIGSAYKNPTISKRSNYVMPKQTLEPFTYINIPKNSSKHYKIPNFLINKIPGREQYEIKKIELPDYNPNYDFNKKRAGSAVPIFDSYISRENLFNKKQYINETVFEYEKAIKNKNNNIFKHKKVPNFKKDIPRRPLTAIIK